MEVELNLEVHDTTTAMIIDYNDPIENDDLFYIACLKDWYKLPASKESIISRSQLLFIYNPIIMPEIKDIEVIIQSMITNHEKWLTIENKRNSNTSIPRRHFYNILRMNPSLLLFMDMMYRLWILGTHSFDIRDSGENEKRRSLIQHHKDPISWVNDEFDTKGNFKEYIQLIRTPIHQLHYILTTLNPIVIYDSEEEEPSISFNTPTDTTKEDTSTIPLIEITTDEHPITEPIIVQEPSKEVVIETPVNVHTKEDRGISLEIVKKVTIPEHGNAMETTNIMKKRIRKVINENVPSTTTTVVGKPQRKVMILPPRNRVVSVFDRIKLNQESIYKVYNHLMTSTNKVQFGLLQCTINRIIMDIKLKSDDLLIRHDLMKLCYVYPFNESSRLPLLEDPNILNDDEYIERLYYRCCSVIQHLPLNIIRFLDFLFTNRNIPHYVDDSYFINEVIPTFYENVLINLNQKWITSMYTCTRLREAFNQIPRFNILRSSDYHKDTYFQGKMTEQVIQEEVLLIANDFSQSTDTLLPLVETLYDTLRYHVYVIHYIQDVLYDTLRIEIWFNILIRLLTQFNDDNIIHEKGVTSFTDLVLNLSIEGSYIIGRKVPVPISYIDYNVILQKMIEVRNHLSRYFKDLWISQSEIRILLLKKVFIVHYLTDPIMGVMKMKNSYIPDVVDNILLNNRGIQSIKDKSIIKVIDRLDESFYGYRDDIRRLLSISILTMNKDTSTSRYTPNNYLNSIYMRIYSSTYVLRKQGDDSGSFIDDFKFLNAFGNGELVPLGFYDTKIQLDVKKRLGFSQQEVIPLNMFMKVYTKSIFSFTENFRLLCNGTGVASDHNIYGDIPYTREKDVSPSIMTSNTYFTLRNDKKKWKQSFQMKLLGYFTGIGGGVGDVNPWVDFIHSDVDIHEIDAFGVTPDQLSHFIGANQGAYLWINTRNETSFNESIKVIVRNPLNINQYKDSPSILLYTDKHQYIEINHPSILKDQDTGSVVCIDEPLTSSSPSQKICNLFVEFRNFSGDWTILTSLQGLSNVICPFAKESNFTNPQFPHTPEFYNHIGSVIGYPRLEVPTDKQRLSIYYYIPTLDENDMNPLHPIDAYLLATIDTLVDSPDITQLVYNDHTTNSIISSFIHTQS